MLLPEVLLDTLPEDSASGIRIFCKDTERQKEIAYFFLTTFDKEWNKGKERCEEEFGIEPDEIYAPIICGPEFDSNSILFLIEPLDMSVNDGARAYNEYGNDALQNTINKMEEKYPDVLYEGCVQYAWFDEHTGETVSYELSENGADKPYDFVGRILNNAIGYGNMIEELEYVFDGEEADKEELLKVVNTYRDYLSEENIEKYTNRIKELSQQ